MVRIWCCTGMRITEGWTAIRGVEYRCTTWRSRCCRRRIRRGCTGCLSCESVEIVRNGFGFCDEEWLHTFGADGDHVVLILQDAFDGEEALAGQQQAIFVKQIGADYCVRYSGLVFQT